MPALPTSFDPNEATRPPTLNGDLEHLPASLAALVKEQRWIVWRWEQNDQGKWTKVPYQSHQPSWKASTAAPHTWGSHGEAVGAVARGLAHGIGYCLKNSDVAALDLDDCRDPESGAIEEWAIALVDEAASYAEATVSGTGIRILGLGVGPHVHRKHALPSGSVESYRRATRYIVVTGMQLPGTGELANIDATIDALVERLDAEKPKPVANGHAPPSRREVLPQELDELIRNGVPQGRRSEEFHHTVGWLKHLGWTSGEIEGELSAHPDGIAQKYIKRLGREVQRCFDKASASTWTPPERVSDDPVAAESQRNLAAIAEQPRGKALDTATLTDFRFDTSPYEPEAMPGLLGQVTRHILETALYPVPDFACLAAIVLCSAIYGRRWSEPVAGGGLNVYVIATAPTGWGKDHPLQEPKQLAWRSDIMHVIGPGEFKSDAAIERQLRKCPIRASFMDEIGIVLQANQARQASSWERRIRKALLEVYSASKGLWTGSQSAGEDIDKGADPIHRPCLSIYGTSTPEELYKGLTEDNIRDGLFGRLIFASPDDKPKRQKPGAGDYDGIREAIDRVRSFTPPGVPDKQRALYHSNLRNAAMAPAVVRVPISGEAISTIEMIADWQRELVEKEIELSRIANRAGENVGKLATLRALSRDHERPEVIYEDVQWAWSIAERSLFVIARDIEEHMVGSEFEGLVKAIRRYLKEAGRDGLPLSKLYERHGVSKFHGRDKEAAIRQLVEGGDVTKERMGNRGFRLVWTGNS